MSDTTSPAVQTPAPTDHPSVAAPKCLDCRHHRQRKGSSTYRPADLCAHPRFSRSLITGEPQQSCADMRGTHLVSADGQVPCGPAGTLYQPADDDAPAVVTRSQLADALHGVLGIAELLGAQEVLESAPARTARAFLTQLRTEAQA